MPLSRLRAPLRCCPRSPSTTHPGDSEARSFLVAMQKARADTKLKIIFITPWNLLSTNCKQEETLFREKWNGGHLPTVYMDWPTDQKSKQSVTFRLLNDGDWEPIFCSDFCYWLSAYSVFSLTANSTLWGKIQCPPQSPLKSKSKKYCNFNISGNWLTFH